MIEIKVMHILAEHQFSRLLDILSNHNPVVVAPPPPDPDWPTLEEASDFLGVARWRFVKWLEETQEKLNPKYRRINGKHCTHISYVRYYARIKG